MVCTLTETSSFPNATRIIGGSKAKIEHFRWQVSLNYNGAHHCGGAIIDSNRILTAAHCTYRISNLNKLTIRVGSTSPTSGGSVYSVSKVVQHPKFSNPTLLNNDIAVVVLAQSLEFGSTVGPIPLARFGLSDGDGVTVSGYGATIVGSSKPSDLHSVSVRVVNYQTCFKAYEKYPGREKLTDNMLCAGLLGVGGKDACQGDSGGF